MSDMSQTIPRSVTRKGGFTRAFTLINCITHVGGTGREYEADVRKGEDGVAEAVIAVPLREFPPSVECNSRIVVMVGPFQSFFCTGATLIEVKVA